MKIRVFGKLNLALEITGKIKGLHTLKMVNASLNLFDEITVEKAPNLSCETVGLSEEENSAYLAAKRFIEKFNTENVKISVNKGIPFGGGLGGSSADAAGVLFAMSEIFNIKDFRKIEEIADSLGSDVKYMLQGGYKFVCGTGNEIKDFPCNLTFSGIIVKGNKSTLSKDAYKKYDEIQGEKKEFADNLLCALICNDKTAAYSYMENDLFTASKEINGEIEDCFNFLLSLNPKKVVMTGSGACVAAFFDGNADKELILAKKKFPFAEKFTVVPRGIEVIER